MAADGPLQVAGSQAIPEAAIGNRTIHESKCPCVAVRQDTLRTMLRDDVAPASCDFRDGVVPGNTFKCPAAFGTNAPHGIEQPLRMIDAIKVAIDLGTEPASRHRVIGASAHTDGSPLL